MLYLFHILQFNKIYFYCNLLYLKYLLLHILNVCHVLIFYDFIFLSSIRTIVVYDKFLTKKQK